MKKVYISIGSNLNDPKKQIKCAIEKLNKLKYTQLIHISSFYKSIPLSQEKQPNYINSIVCINTNLSPKKLLINIQSIETDLGRTRTLNKWSSRTIDLDIILYENIKIKTNNLIIPHYDFHRRDFVLFPLKEIEPNLIFPDGESISKKISFIQQSKLKLYKNI